jgi:hypothetical protein
MDQSGRATEMRLVREHRGGLDESMTTVRPVRDREHLIEVIRESLAPFGKIVESAQISVGPYCFDPRIEWDTYIIEIEGYGVWGMANGPI